MISLQAAMPETLALFDLDHTLIPFDSGMQWTAFLVARGLLPTDAPARHLAHCQAYVAGTLDIHAMHRASFEPLLRFSRAELAREQLEFEGEIARRLPRWSLDLVRRHREQGHLCAIVTATTRLIAEPFARLFGVPHLVATRAATVDGTPDAAYTGEIEGTPCYREHKVSQVCRWLEAQRPDAPRIDAFARSWFYSDSIGDLALLDAVTDPVAVRPDERLRAHALKAGWPVLDPV